MTTTARRRGSLSERFGDGRGIYSDQFGGGGGENLPYTRSLHLRRSEGACSESSEDSRSLFTLDGRGDCQKNPGNGPHLVRSKRSRVVMGARSVGRDRRSSLMLDERGKSVQGQKPFICPKTPPEKEPSISSRRRFFNWMRKLSGRKEKQVDKEVAGGSPGKGGVASEVCDTCQEVSEEQKSSSSQFPGSYETKVFSSHYS